MFVSVRSVWICARCNSEEVCPYRIVMIHRRYEVLHPVCSQTLNGGPQRVNYAVCVGWGGVAES